MGTPDDGQGAGLGAKICEPREIGQRRVPADKGATPDERNGERLAGGEHQCNQAERSTLDAKMYLHPSRHTVQQPLCGRMKSSNSNPRPRAKCAERNTLRGGGNRRGTTTTDNATALPKGMPVNPREGKRQLCRLANAGYEPADTEGAEQHREESQYGDPQAGRHCNRKRVAPKGTTRIEGQKHARRLMSPSGSGCYATPREAHCASAGRSTQEGAPPGLRRCNPIEGASRAVAQHAHGTRRAPSGNTRFCSGFSDPHRRKRPASKDRQGPGGPHCTTKRRKHTAACAAREDGRHHQQLQHDAEGTVRATSPQEPLPRLQGRGWHDRWPPPALSDGGREADAPL